MCPYQLKVVRIQDANTKAAERDAHAESTDRRPYATWVRIATIRAENEEWQLLKRPK